MKTELDKIMSEAMDLPAPLRAFLAAKLIESLDANGAQELSDEWKEEIRGRCREIDEGTVRLVDAEEAIAKAYARLTEDEGVGQAPPCGCRVTCSQRVLLIEVDDAAFFVGFEAGFFEGVV